MNTPLNTFFATFQSLSITSTTASAQRHHLPRHTNRFFVFDEQEKASIARNELGVLEPVAMPAPKRRYTVRLFLMPKVSRPLLMFATLFGSARNHM